jgi:hypothetical protein
MGHWHLELQQEHLSAPQQLVLQKAASAWGGAVKVAATVASRPNASRVSFFFMVDSPLPWERAGDKKSSCRGSPLSV